MLIRKKIHENELKMFHVKIHMSKCKRKKGGCFVFLFGSRKKRVLVSDERSKMRGKAPEQQEKKCKIKHQDKKRAK